MADSIIRLLVGLAVFITGMNMLSSGLEKVTGKGLKNLMRRIRNNPVAGLGVGAGATALMQSGSSTAVMAVGFISSGAMSVYQGVTVILGAFIGTTMTTILVSLSGFGTISPYLGILAFVGIILLFFTNEKIKHIGEILCGLGMLFFGLQTMTQLFDPETSLILEGSQQFFQAIDNPLLMLLIGAVFTILIHSSSAASGVVTVFVSSNVISVSSGLFLILGATVGTAIRTLYACIGYNEDVKRTGFITLLFSSMCCLIATAILWPLQGQVSSLLTTTFSFNLGFGIAIFYVCYALAFFPLQIPFLNLYIDLSKKVFKDKPEVKGKAVRFIDDHLLKTPSVAMMQVKREIINMMRMAYGNLTLGFSCVIEQNLDQEKAITETEENIDYINDAITQYLIKLSPNLEAEDEKKVGAYFHVINDIERIGDHAFNFLNEAKTMVDSGLSFSSHACSELKEMFDIISEMCNLSITIFHDQSTVDLARLHELENATDTMKETLSNEHYIRISKNECQVELSPFYTSMVSELERIADHIVNIGYSVVNPTGDDENVSLPLENNV